MLLLPQFLSLIQLRAPAGDGKAQRESTHLNQPKRKSNGPAQRLSPRCPVDNTSHHRVCFGVASCVQQQGPDLVTQKAFLVFDFKCRRLAINYEEWKEIIQALRQVPASVLRSEIRKRRAPRGRQIVHGGSPQPWEMK